MDDLRWILLAAVVVIVAVIFFFSRSRKKENYEMPLDIVDDVPSFTASDSASDGWVDGVGPVKVMSSFRADEDVTPEDKPLNKEDSISIVDEAVVEKIEADDSDKENKNLEAESNTEFESDSEEEDKTRKEVSTKDESIDDVISVYVLAKNSELLKGEKILSASYGLHLEHGEMKIFHRYLQTARKEIQFSMANTQVPGWFDVDEMHQMETNGVSFFMQVNLVDKPSEALSEMLICAHSLSQMLGATLCNAQRKPLDEETTNELREKVKRLEQNKAKLVK